MPPPSLLDRPSPAIVGQAAVQRMPQWWLWGLCVVYVLVGFVGREPWREQDLTSLGYILALAKDQTDWFNPSLLGLFAEQSGLLAYWLGAVMWKLVSAIGLNDAFVRLPFILLFLAALASLWRAIVALGTLPSAQPVGLAFGTQAVPADYARALADAGVLALIACLGLARLGHEISPELVQMACAVWCLHGLATGTAQAKKSAFMLAFALPALVLAGAPGYAFCYAMIGLFLPRPAWWKAVVAGLAAAVLVLAWALYGWPYFQKLPVLRGLMDMQWLFALPKTIKLIVWFSWPVGLIGLWSVWRWRRHLGFEGHLALPLAFAGVGLVAALLQTQRQQENLLLALPGLAVLAAFALPTLSRRTTSFIDWLAVAFFSLGMLVFWTFWLSMHWGWPSKPMQRVQALAPGFEGVFSWWAFLIALVASVLWLRTIAWRVQRHRKPLWKSMALPAMGACLVWVLAMTVFLPVLDYARSHRPLVARIGQAIQAEQANCVATYGLDRAELAALSYYLPELPMQAFQHTQPSQHVGNGAVQCAWLLTKRRVWEQDRLNPQRAQQVYTWRTLGSYRRPTQRRPAGSDVLFLRRV